MDHELVAELYLSFALIFQRPVSDVSDNLEEFVELWASEIAEPHEPLEELCRFCREFPCGEERLQALWEQYIPLFTADIQVPPYASVYLSDEGLVLGEESVRVQRFYEQTGYEVSGLNKELPDHLAVELEFAALMARDGQDDVLRSFRRYHLKPFLAQIIPKIKKANPSVYAAVAELLENWQSKF